MPPEKMSDVVLYATYDDGHTEPVIIKELQDLTITEAERELDKVDFVKVVRCKDCKHYKAYEYTGKLACHYVIGGTVEKKPDDFCSRAERKDI